MPKETVTRSLAHEPLGHGSTALLVRHHQCSECECSWRQETVKTVDWQAKIFGNVLPQWAVGTLGAVVIDHLTASRVATGLKVS